MTVKQYSAIYRALLDAHSDASVELKLGRKLTFDADYIAENLKRIKDAMETLSAIPLNLEAAL